MPVRSETADGGAVPAELGRGRALEPSLPPVRVGRGAVIASLCKAGKRVLGVTSPVKSAAETRGIAPLSSEGAAVREPREALPRRSFSASARAAGRLAEPAPAGSRAETSVSRSAGSVSLAHRLGGGCSSRALGFPRILGSAQVCGCPRPVWPGPQRTEDRTRDFLIAQARYPHPQVRGGKV